MKYALKDTTRLFFHALLGNLDAPAERFDVLGQQILVAAGHMVVQGGFHIRQGEHFHTGQQRADRDHVGQARVADLFGDLVAGNGYNSNILAPYGSIHHGFIDHQPAAR